MEIQILQSAICQNAFRSVVQAFDNAVQGYQETVYRQLLSGLILGGVC